MIFSKKILKFVYNSMLFGMPISTYNPYTKVPIHIPATVEEGSTYINFKLNKDEKEYLNNYIHEYNKSLNIVPISILEDEKAENYLSINIYNCTSPVFDKVVTRCEINTYIKDKDNNIGTIILDYLSNDLSMDPVNIFKNKVKTNFKKKNVYHYIDCESDKDEVKLNLNFTKFREKQIGIHDNLIDYTDKVFYKNGVYDKVYYDSTLVRAKYKAPIYTYNFSFLYKDLEFNEIDSIFYFSDKIDFVGGIWTNLYNL